METRVPLVDKIISGGQTGVDRAALDVALYLEIDHGGWCPRGRRSEAGPIPPIYQLNELDSRDYSVRTEKNVIDSDGTLILHWGKLSGGTALTLKFCEHHARPRKLMDLESFESMGEVEQQLALTETVEWWKSQGGRVLNVAGPRESSSPGIGNSATAFLLNLLRA